MTAGVKREADGTFACVDENEGQCPTEQYILCGFRQAADITAKINFLVCVDEEEGDAPARAQTCAKQSQFDWSTLSSCVSSDGLKLLGEASDYYMRSGVHRFPTIQVNGKERVGRDYDDIMEEICATGISAGACGAGPHPSPTPVPPPPPTPMPTPTPEPTPSPSPSPSPSANHYGKPPCQADETSIKVGSGMVCAPTCSDSCPTDTPGQGSIFDPACGTGDYAKYCVIQCFDDSDCDSSGGANCVEVNGMGMCAYGSTLLLSV